MFKNLIKIEDITNDIIAQYGEFVEISSINNLPQIFKKSIKKKPHLRVWALSRADPK